jgi:hypothetical protein
MFLAPLNICRFGGGQVGATNSSKTRRGAERCVRIARGRMLSHAGLFAALFEAVRRARRLRRGLLQSFLAGFTHCGFDLGGGAG